MASGKTKNGAPLPIRLSTRTLWIPDATLLKAGVRNVSCNVVAVMALTVPTCPSASTASN